MDRNPGRPDRTVKNHDHPSHLNPTSVKIVYNAWNSINTHSRSYKCITDTPLAIEGRFWGNSGVLASISHPVALYISGSSPDCCSGGLPRFSRDIVYIPFGQPMQLIERGELLASAASCGKVGIQLFVQDGTQRCQLEACC